MSDVSTTVRATAVVSSVCTSFTGDTSNYNDATNLSVTITTYGRPVLLSLVADPNGSNLTPGRVGYSSDAAAGHSNPVFGGAWVKNGSALNYIFFPIDLTIVGGGTTTLTPSLSPGVIQTIDYGASAGTHTYKIQVRWGSLNYVRLLAIEL